MCYMYKGSSVTFHYIILEGGKEKWLGMEERETEGKGQNGKDNGERQ